MRSFSFAAVLVLGACVPEPALRFPDPAVTARRHLDRDHSGSLTVEDLHVDHAADVFTLADGDGDGQLTTAEVGTALSDFAPQAQKATASPQHPPGHPPSPPPLGAGQGGKAKGGKAKGGKAKGGKAKGGGGRPESDAFGFTPLDPELQDLPESTLEP